MRIGSGFDIHRLVPGRKLVLGGVTIPFEKGLLGHSDADVLTHAICDALLGAAALGDIGQHFPDTDDRYKDIDSLKLLSYTMSMIEQKGYRVGNIDATIFAEAPKVGPHRDDMRITIANTIHVEKSKINIKATTLEGLGAIGRGEGIGAMCTALLEPV